MHFIGVMSVTRGWTEVMQVLHKVCEGGDGCPGVCGGVSLQ